MEKNETPEIMISAAQTKFATQKNREREGNDNTEREPEWRPTESGEEENIRAERRES